MPDDIDDLWREFAAESQEHLDALVWLLSDWREHHWTEAEIAGLFRYFHSLKGSCLAVGFVTLAGLAHRAEDILSLVRDGTATLDPSLASILLRTADRLVDMRERALIDRCDVEPDPALLAEFDRYCGGPATAILATGPATAKNQAGSASADLSLGVDADLLAIYGEILEQRLALLAGAFSAVAAEQTVAAETAAELAFGAETLGFEGLAAELRAISQLVADPAGRMSLLTHFAQLRQQAALLEEITGQAAGTMPLTSALSGRLVADGLAALDILAVALEEPSEACIEPIRAVLAVCSTLGHATAIGLLLLLEEQYGRRDVVRQSGPSELAFAVVETLRAAIEAGVDAAPEMAAAIEAEWRAGMTGSGRRAGRGTGFPLSPEIVATLSAAQRTQLDHAFAEGNRHAYQLLLALEADPEIADSVIAWLETTVETVTSRTIRRDGTSAEEFIVLSAQPIDGLRVQIESLDPEQRCVRAFTEIRRDVSGRPEKPNVAMAQIIRVGSESLDRLMAEIGEMRSSLAALSETLRHGPLVGGVMRVKRAIIDLPSAESGPLGTILDGTIEELRSLAEIEESLARAHRRIWEAGLALRVIPVAPLFARIARAVRDLAQQLGKQVDFVVEGRDVRIDKSMVDLLIDPLMHLVRNALDHGIEGPEQRAALGKPASARLRLTAAERTHGIVITVEDDGKGLDRLQIRAKAIERGLVSVAEAAQLSNSAIDALIFKPGFSTRNVVTDISGRGVGLDVVAEALARVGGTSQVETEPGLGTRVILSLPVSAALLRALLVRVCGETLALPERHIAAVIEIDRNVVSDGLFEHDGQALRLYPLGQLLGLDDGSDPGTKPVQIAILAVGGSRLGLAIDQFLRFEDLFLKEMSPLLASLPAVGGTSVLGDGRPVLVLDADRLADLIEGRL